MTAQTKQRGVKRDWQTKVARVMRGDSAMHSGGYRVLYVPMHPRAVAGYVYEHRVVAEAKIGRFLLPHEEVHHLNRDRSDNRPENLEVVTDAEHGAFHATVVTDEELALLLTLGAQTERLKAVGVATKRLARARKTLIARGICPLMCANGHVLTAANRFPHKTVGFGCRACQRDRLRTRYAA